MDPFAWILAYGQIWVYAGFIMRPGVWIISLDHSISENQRVFKQTPICKRNLEIETL